MFKMLTGISLATMIATSAYAGDLARISNGLADFTITSLEDSLEIRAVTVNHGNCGNNGLWFSIDGVFSKKDFLADGGFIMYRNPYPITLKFGQSARFIPGCRAIELILDTDQGSETFTLLDD